MEQAPVSLKAQSPTNFCRAGMQGGLAMLFVCMGKFKAASAMKQRVARRLDWKYPAGMRVLAEYWLQSTDPAFFPA